MHLSLPAAGADCAHRPTLGTPLILGHSHDDVSFKKRELGRGRILKCPKGLGRNGSKVFLGLCYMQGFSGVWLSVFMGTMPVCDRGRQEALQSGRFARVTEHGSSGAAVWTQGLLALECRIVRIEGRGGPSPESWGTLDKAGVLSDRGYGGLFLNAFPRVLSHFSQLPQKVKTGSSLSLL